MFMDFLLMVQYAAAAYYPENFDSRSSRIQCPNMGCPLVENAQAETVIEFNSKLPSGVTGFVALDNANELIVIAFRGSASLNGWLTDLDLAQTPTPFCKDCTAHHGFWQSWLDARPSVLAAVERLCKENPTYRVRTTGHSLGGAIATLAAADMRVSRLPTTFFSYGAPRASNAALATFITQQTSLGANYRVTHWNDPVPNVPPIAMGFAHVSPEYYIDVRGWGDAFMGDVKIFYGVRNLLGNARWLLVDVRQHLWYFKEIGLL